MLGIDSTKNLGINRTPSFQHKSQVVDRFAFSKPPQRKLRAPISKPISFAPRKLRCAHVELQADWWARLDRVFGSRWGWPLRVYIYIVLMFLFANSITNEWMNVGVSWRCSILFSSTSTLKRWRKVTLKVLSLGFITLRCCSSLGPGQWWHYCLASRHHFASLVVGFWIRFCGVGHPVLRQVPLDLTTIFWEWKFQLIFFLLKMWKRFKVLK